MCYVPMRLLGCVAIIAALVLCQKAQAEEPAGVKDKATRTSVFNEKWLDAVVSVERLDGEGRSQAIGTGFLLQTVNNHVLFLTAKHVVIDDNKVVRKDLAFLLNRITSGTDLIYDSDLERQKLGSWFFSKTSDLACRFISWPSTTKIATIPQSAILSANELNAGAPLLLLGFPLGNRSTDHARAIARRGMVARADSDGIIVDALVFPGNSGGPAVYVPAIKVGGGIKSPIVNEEKLVGVVSNYITYQEKAVSQQTKRPRIVFEENSGLANLVPGDAILDLLNSSEVQRQDAEIIGRDTRD